MAETEVRSINGMPLADTTARKNIEDLKKAAPGLVFDTVADMEAYIAASADTLKVGQDLFIREADAPDYWWDGTAAVPVETDLSEVKGDIKEIRQTVADQQTAIAGKQPIGDYALRNEIPSVPVQSVNGKTGAVSLSASDVGALPAGTKIPAKTSDITNDSGFITNGVSDLVNYYLKKDLYTQTEVNALVSAIPKFSISVVSALPTSGISTTTIYLLKSGSDADLYTEYIYVNGAWEILGSQRVDLTGYATETWVNAKLVDYLTAETLTAAIITAALGYTPADAADVYDEIYILKEGETIDDAPDAAKEVIDPYSDSDTVDLGVFVTKTGISLGIHSDGKYYVFVDGAPVGTGFELSGNSGDVFGYVDENNIIVLNGNLTNGSYTIKYEMEDGSTIDIGDLVLDSNVYYSVTNTLTNCTTSNSDTKAIGGQAYTATITANDGYELSSVVVTMGGINVSASAVSGSVISIAEVTGNIVITAAAEESIVEPSYTNLATPDATATGQTAWESGGWCNNSRIGSGSYTYREDDTRITTNTIAVSYNDIIYVKGITFEGSDTIYPQIAIFDEAGSYLVHRQANVMQTAQGAIANLTATEGSDYWHFKNALNSGGGDVGTRYIRIAGLPSGSINDIIITRNEPIE